MKLILRYEYGTNADILQFWSNALVEFCITFVVHMFVLFIADSKFYVLIGYLSGR